MEIINNSAYIELLPNKIIVATVYYTVATIVCIKKQFAGNNR